MWNTDGTYFAVSRKLKISEYLNLFNFITMCDIMCVLLAANSAFGCLNPSPPAHGFAERNGTLAKIGCYASADSDVNGWEITCIDNMWHGDVGNCSAREFSRLFRYPGDSIGFESNMSFLSHWNNSPICVYIHAYIVCCNHIVLNTTLLM